MNRRRGFTLIELMVVVVLVAILSTIAILAYRHFVNSAKNAEAAHNIAGIAVAQQVRKQESGTYVNVSGSLDHLYPAATPGKFKSAWGGPCGACLTSWSALAFHPDAPVAFGYATVASRTAVPQELGGNPGGGGGPGGPGGGGSNSFGFNGGGGSESDSIPDPSNPGSYLPDATGPYFTIVAKADADGNGVYASALYYSETNNIVFDLEGE